MAKPLAILALWRTHDAFEVALLPDEAERLQTLLPEAHARARRGRRADRGEPRA
jgi:hypothetical protein